MYVTDSDTARRARWAVMWVASNGRKTKVVRKDFGDDYASAEALYLKAVKAGKKAATLACVNMGFPPPKELRPRVVRKRGRDKRTRKLRVIKVELEPLKELNMEGKLWCPYCRKLRPFILRKKFNVNGVILREPLYVCPICGISHRNHHVRVWNPTAALHMENVVSVRRGSRTRSSAPTRRRRRR